jgi:hypothetical protein
LGSKARLSIALVLVAGLMTASISAFAQNFEYQDFEADEFERVWERTDYPVLQTEVSRTWLWGPGAITGMMIEPYTEAEDGERQVQYTDKSRMEMPVDEVDDDSPWFITQGLLATELMTGELQIGHEDFVQHDPSQIGVAGDPDDETGPSYAAMGGLMDEEPREEGGVIIETVDAAGQIDENADLADYGATDYYFVEETGHYVASVFWEFMDSSGLVFEDGEFVDDQPIFENPFYAIGFPKTPAYWGWVKVNNVEQNVLIQCFERRCLTYAPGNPEGWEVESGNIGQHYYNWRYHEIGDPVEPEADLYVDVTEVYAENTEAGSHEVTASVHDYADDHAQVDIESADQVTVVVERVAAADGAVTTLEGEDVEVVITDGAAVVTYGDGGPAETSIDNITVTVEHEGEYLHGGALKNWSLDAEYLQNNDDNDHNGHDGPPELPRHPHMLLVGVEIDMEVGPAGAIVDYLHCGDIANGAMLPNHVHHATLHQGPQAELIQAAGHFVIPGTPLGGFANCEDVELPVMFPPPPAED